MRQGPSGLPHHSLPQRLVGLPDDSFLRPGAPGAPPARPALHAAPQALAPPAAGGSAPAAGAGAASCLSRAPPGGGERLPSEETGYDNTVKISHNSKVAAVAGKIAHSLRAREWPTLLVAGNGSIHAAIKCCITAGRFVQAEGLSIEFEPLFREADHSRALLALAVLPTPAAASSPRAGGAATGAAGAGPAERAAEGALVAQQEIKVSAQSRHAKVGAALSARLLDAPASPAVLSALGEAAVANAVMAAAHAAHYLAARGTRRLAVQVRASVVVKGSDQLSGVQLWVWLQGGGAFDPGGGEAGAVAEAAAALAALASK